MGPERFRGRKPIHLCLVLLIFLVPLACTISQSMSTKITDTTGDEARAHLALGRTLLAGGEYAQALGEYQSVLSLAGRDVPRDEALFYIGLIQAHPANPARDYGKSLASFRGLLEDYPGSALAEQAKTLAGLLQENEKLDRTVGRQNTAIAEQAKTLTGLSQEKEKLDRTVNRLNTVIDELKQVDIGVEQKKREKGI